MDETSRRAIKKKLRQIPNIGPAMAEDLLRLKIHSLADLTNQDPEEIYTKLCRIDGIRHDPCVKDVFHAITDFAKGAPARPWWYYSRIRKNQN